nr:(Fe-S)-binding protein [Alphaproteobacteria bacterium]
FSVAYPEISNAMVTKKCRALEENKPDLVTGCELGCLLNIAGKLRRGNNPIACRHIAEILSGDLKEPAIGVGK